MISVDDVRFCKLYKCVFICNRVYILYTHSFYAIYKITPIAHRMVYLGGWMHGICDSRSYIGSYGGGIWAFLFPLSKLLELVDTAFIVLRKQKMVFLHWYHHITGKNQLCWPHVLGACIQLLHYYYSSYS